MSCNKKLKNGVSKSKLSKKRCVCKSFIDGKQIEEKKVPDTEHSKRYEVIGVPQVLHIKVKHNQDGRKEDINFSNFINMRGTRFRLQTAMIYDESALQGHWRSRALC